MNQKSSDQRLFQISNSEPRNFEDTLEGTVIKTVMGIFFYNHIE